MLGVRLMRYSPTVTSGVLLRMMSLSSSKKVKMSMSMTNVTSTIANVRTNSRRTYSSRIRGKRPRGARLRAVLFTGPDDAADSSARNRNQLPSEASAEIAAPPVAIWRNSTMPHTAKMRLACQTPRKTGILCWRASAVPVEERK